MSVFLPRSFSAIFARMLTTLTFGDKNAGTKNEAFFVGFVRISRLITVIQFAHGVSRDMCKHILRAIETYFSTVAPGSFGLMHSIGMRSCPIIWNDAYIVVIKAPIRKERVMLRSSSYSCKHYELCDAVTYNWCAHGISIFYDALDVIFNFSPSCEPRRVWKSINWIIEKK